jgi:branched-chain amino acid transport system ATP-binding protein
MSTSLLQVSQLSKRFGGFVALDSVDFSVAAGERLGLIGPNGSGKSTLVNCVGGTLRHDAGQVRFDGHVLDGLPPHQRVRRGLARTFQLPRPFPSLTVAENLRVPVEYVAAVTAGAEANAQCDALLEMVGLHERARVLPRDLTQVEMRKLELARAMAASPRLLIADEVMAGLSLSEVDELLTLLLRLNDQGVAIVMIEHIMRAVMLFSQRLVVLVAGRKVADGDPAEVVRNPEVERAYLGE